MGYNSAFVRDIYESCASVGGGGFGVGPSNAASEILPLPTLVAIA